MGNKTKETFKQRMKRIRVAAGFKSQGAAARAIGCERGTVSMWEAPSSPVESVSGEFLLAAAVAYNVDPHWMNTGDGEERPYSDFDALAEHRGAPGWARPAVVPRTYEDDDEIEIPQLAVEGAMGDGSFPPDHVDVVQNVIARISELRKQCTFTSPQNLEIITGIGRSMYPTFSDGDPLLVDRGVTTVDVDAVYVFTFEKKLYIKGLQRIPGNGLRAISHNREESDSWDIPASRLDELLVHGRVVLAWNARRL